MRTRTVVVIMGLFGCCAAASADTIRLKNGRMVEGQIVREDETSVTVMIGSQPEFYARSEVESVSRGLHLNVSTTPRPMASSQTTGRVIIDETPLKQIGQRVRAFHEGFHQLREAAVSLRTIPSSQALEQVRHALASVLPTRGGAWDLGSLLLDLLIAILVRAPVVWIASTVVRGQPHFLRAGAFALLLYGLTLLGSVVVTLAPAQPLALAWFTGLIVAGSVVGVAVPLFMWLFNTGLVPSGCALLIYVGLSAGVDHVLLNIGLW